MSIIHFDCETTGLLKAEASPDNQQPYITEICIIRTDDECNVEQKYVQMFNPPIVVLDPRITEITGITLDQLKSKRPFKEHWREIADIFLGCKTMVAHNVTFDRGCLYYELKRAGKLLNFPWPPEHHCTIEQSMSFQGKKLNLGALHEHLFGHKFDGAHRAEADVEALIRCYKKMHKKGEYKDA